MEGKKEENQPAEKKETITDQRLKQTTETTPANHLSSKRKGKRENAKTKKKRRSYSEQEKRKLKEALKNSKMRYKRGKQRKRQGS